jgi:heptaprenyl diphosphate synthase component I
VNKINNPQLVPLLAGLTFFCASLELLVPKFVPFFRLGLANAVLLVATKLLGAKLFCLLLLVKVLGQAVISGTLFSYVFIFSLVGTFASGTICYVLANTLHEKVSFAGISCAGAFASNCSQLLLAYFFVFGKSVMMFAPLVLLFGLITSIPIGVFAALFVKQSQWYTSLFSNSDSGAISHESEKPKAVFDLTERECLKARISEHEKLDAKIFCVKICVAVLLFAGMAIAQNIFFTASVFLIAIFLCIASKIKINIRAFFIFSISVLLTNIFQMNGKLLFEFMQIKITDGAIIAGLEKIAFFQSMLLFSKWVSARSVKLPSRFGFLLARSFENFNILLSNVSLLDKKNIIKSLDAILLRCHF